MNFRLILFILTFFLAFTVKGQLHNDSLSTDVIFYSNANMYVGKNYTVASEPSLYINGSAKYVDSGNTADKIQITQVGTTQLMGDFVDSLYVADPSTLNKLFSADSYDSNSKTGGVILFAGVDKRQRIYREVDPNNNNYRGHNYINFPIIRVNQSLTDPTPNLNEIGHVVVEPTASISVEDLQIGNGLQGGFTLDAQYTPNKPNEIQSAFALIKNLNTGHPKTTDGWCRVDLTLADMSKPETYTPNYVVGMDSVEASRRYLTGFTPPFEKMAADYMFFQVLFIPDKRDLTSFKGAITDPDEKLLGGRGYFIAQEVGDNDYDDIEDNSNNNYIKRQHRFAGNYQFGRKLFNDYYHNGGFGSKPNFSRYASTNTTDIAEYFNTEPVKVTLEAGINFLGNPFMAPLDLSTLIAPVSDNPADKDYYTDGGNYQAYKAKGLFKYVSSSIASTVQSKYNAVNVEDTEGHVSVTRGKYAFTDYDLRGRYWIMKEGSIRYQDEGANYGHWFYYSVTNDVGKQEGGTVSLNPGDTKHLIPPMGMFCVQSGSAFDMYILPPTETSLRAGHVVAPKSISSAKEKVVDELLIQVLDTESQTEDRTCLVFRDQSMTDNKYSYIRTSKNFSRSIENSSAYILPEGSVYTKSLDSLPMLSNPVSKDIKQVALYVVPSQTRVKHIKITPYRMQTLQSINKVWIEDRLNPGVYQELTPDGVEYVLEPSAADPKTDLANRFVLYFNDLPNGGKVENENSLIVYYHASTLYIKGLTDDDLGSKVDIYDIQGRKVAATIIRDIPTTSYLKPLAHGTYIVKITGKRNHTSKFISLQN